MINEILDKVQDGDGGYAKAKYEALTAIYEIGLAVIGAAKKLPKVDWDADQSYAEHAIKAQNQLIASQRKAWAKACGVKDA